MEENNQDLNNVVQPEEAPVMDTPVAEPVVEATPEVVAEAPVEAAPVVEDTPAAEVTPVEETVPAEPVVEAPAEVAPVEAAPVVEETPVAEVAPVEETVPAEPVVEAPAEVAPVEGAPVVEETPVAEVAPVEETVPAEPVVEAPAEMPAMEAPTVEAPAEQPLPVVDPVPAVTEMPEPEVQITGTTEGETPATPAETPTEVSSETPAGEEKKGGKTGLIIIVVVLLIAIAAAVYFFLIKGKDEPAPKPVDNTNTTVKSQTKYLKAVSEDYDIEYILNEDKTYTKYKADGSTYIVEEGTYTVDGDAYTFTPNHEYTDGTCTTLDGLTTTQIVTGSNGTLKDADAVEFEETEDKNINHVNEMESVKSISCDAASVEDDNTTTVEPEKNETAEVTTVEVESISLNKTELKATVGDKAVTLTATVLPKNATDKNVTWETSNKDVATVDSKGKVTYKAEGTTTITAKTSNGKEATCTVTVSPKATEQQTSQNDKPNCTYDVETVDTEGSTAYKKLKKALNGVGEDAGTDAANNCKTLAQIIEDVKAAVSAEAEKCWSAEHVTKAVETAECKLTPGCDKTDKYGEEAKFASDKQQSIESMWHNKGCSRSYEL